MTTPAASTTTIVPDLDFGFCLCPADVLAEHGCRCDEALAATCDTENPETCESCQ
jgi:hypothetical protein